MFSIDIAVFGLNHRRPHGRIEETTDDRPDGPTLTDRHRGLSQWSRTGHVRGQGDEHSCRISRREIEILMFDSLTNAEGEGRKNHLTVPSVRELPRVGLPSFERAKSVL